MNNSKIKRYKIKIYNIEFYLNIFFKIYNYLLFRFNINVMKKLNKLLYGNENLGFYQLINF